MAYDEALAARLRKATADMKGVTEKKMFGGICFLLNDYMLGGVETDRYMFRIGKDNEEGIYARPGVKPMDFTGRPLGGMIYVDADHCKGEAMQGFIKLAASHIATLPPKKPKKKKARKARAAK